MSNLATRAITGIIFVLVIVGAILSSPYAFIGLFALIAALMLTEFYQLMNKHQGVKLNLPVNITGGLLLFTGSALFSLGIVKAQIFLLYLAYLIILWVSELYRKKPEPIRNWAYALLGQIYIALPFALLNIIGFSESTYKPALLLGLFVFIWLNDTGAYLVGSRIGKRRLFERISPKKSWEGFWGGIGFAMLGGYLFSLIFTDLTIWQWVGFGAIVALFSTWGDLSESLLKRTIGVKDSGKMLPGHGGMLDRFDSVLLACPAAVIYLELILSL
ncbi:MAG: phosphatidate cytidylyltransferase [Bacteroidales bacterium]